MSSILQQGEDQWQEAIPTESSNAATPAGVVKGPTMPTQADLEQLVTKSNSTKCLT